MTDETNPKNKPGPKPSVYSRSIPRSIRVSEAVDQYLRIEGTGIIEILIRDSDHFQKWSIKKSPRKTKGDR